MRAVLKQTNARRRAARLKPRVGFLGLGWIGRNRLEWASADGAIEVAGLADISRELSARASELAPKAALGNSLETLLELDLDGVVIATPSALHAGQAIQAIERGCAVFCQKPLGRDSAETWRVIETARRADRLLGVDFSYRHTKGMQEIRRLVRDGALGRVFAGELTFHNAYGPDKPWFYELERSGGGCVIDLGIHLVDLAMWVLGGEAAEVAAAELRTRGARVPAVGVEDFAAVQMRTGGAVLQLGCSWNLCAGCDAVIRLAFYGDRGGACFQNVDGSFYDFVTERYERTQRFEICRESRVWGGGAIVQWARRLAVSNRYDPDVESAGRAAELVEAIYRRGRTG